MSVAGTPVESIELRDGAIYVAETRDGTIRLLSWEEGPDGGFWEMLGGARHAMLESRDLLFTLVEIIPGDD